MAEAAKLESKLDQETAGKFYGEIHTLHPNTEFRYPRGIAFFAAFLMVLQKSW